MNSKPIIAICVLAALFYVWPNIVHEPLHLAALRLLNIKGSITFDWTHFPAHPSIARYEPLQTVSGGLLFLLLPSIFSAGVLLFLWLTRQHAGILTHIILPSYLVTDLIVNMITFKNPISDFRFFTLFPIGAFISAGCSALAGFLIIWKSLRVLQNKYGAQKSSLVL